MGGVFGENGGYSDGPKSVERCKRDYETEIARAKQDLAMTTDLREALDGYLGIHGHHGRDTFTLTSLYGALVLSEKRTVKAIYEIQEAWENDKVA